MRKLPAGFEQNIEFWWAFEKIQGFSGTFSTQSVTKVENKHKSWTKQTHGHIFCRKLSSSRSSIKNASSSATIIVDFSLKLILSRAKPKQNIDEERKCQAESRKVCGKIMRQNIDVGRANLGHDYLPALDHKIPKNGCTCRKVPQAWHWYASRIYGAYGHIWRA